MSPDEAIAAEEAALKELEAEVAELRRQVCGLILYSSAELQKRAKAQANSQRLAVQDDDEPEAFPSSSSSLLAQKTPPPAHASLLDTSPPPALSPSPPRGPMKTPVRNVAIQRARAANTPLAHFSPTRPAASVRRPLGQPPGPRASIFAARKRMPVRASTPPPIEETSSAAEEQQTPVRVSPAEPVLDEEVVPIVAPPSEVVESGVPAVDDGDATIRLEEPPVLAPPVPVENSKPVPETEPAEQSGQVEEPARTQPAETVDSPLADDAAVSHMASVYANTQAKIWAQLSELMKQGDNAPVGQSNDVESTL